MASRYFITVKETTRQLIDNFKNANESYDSVISRLVSEKIFSQGEIKQLEE